MKQLIAKIASDLDLTEHERNLRIPGGDTLVINSRVQWAKTHLTREGLLSEPQRGVVMITTKGRTALIDGQLDAHGLLSGRCPENRPGMSDAPCVSGVMTSQHRTLNTCFDSKMTSANTPEEQIDAALSSLESSLRNALLIRMLESSPAFFERLIVDLLVAMGYGGSRVDAGQKLGGTGDGGVDGVIREDHLGLDRIYIQAKRYAPGNTIGSSAIRDFIGALVGKNAHRGVFITTSRFSEAAIETATKSGDRRLVLIDGPELTTLMLQFNVGVRVARSMEIKRVDPDYFTNIDIE